MRYKDFEHIISEERMTRYVQACSGNTRKAMTLYRYNLQLSQALLYGLDHARQVCNKINELKE